MFGSLFVASLILAVVTSSTTESIKSGSLDTPTNTTASTDKVIFHAHVTKYNNVTSSNVKTKTNKKENNEKKKDLDSIPTPSTCFDNDYDFYSCCINGVAHGMTCWQGNRTSTLCCQTQNNVEWEYCDNTPSLLFDHISVAPSPPIIGQNVTVDITLNYANNTQIQNNGKIYVSVEQPNNLKHSMNVMGNVSYNLCNVSSNNGNICPLTPGSQISLSFVIPGSIISNDSVSAGVYLARGSVWGDNSNLLTCLKILFQLNSPKSNQFLGTNQNSDDNEDINPSQPQTTKDGK